MTHRQTPRISSRKQPRQARSTELVRAILQAATQVLESEGVHRFTTARVAEKAGISIGSLYQYFPNKAAILFRLQHNEWQQTSDMLCRILEDVRQPPHARLRTLVHTFIQSEYEEATMRQALNDAAPFYRDAPEAQQAKSAADTFYQAFMCELLPQASQQTLKLAGELLITTLGSVGHTFTEKPRTTAEITAWADAMADMFEAWIERLSNESHREPDPDSESR